MQQFDGDDQDETTAPADPGLTDDGMGEDMESLDELSDTEVADDNTTDEA